MNLSHFGTIRTQQFSSSRNCLVKVTKPSNWFNHNRKGKLLENVWWETKFKLNLSEGNITDIIINLFVLKFPVYDEKIFSFQNLLVKHKSVLVQYYDLQFPVGIWLLKINNSNTRTRCEICSKLTTKASERRQWHRSVVFMVNFEHISHLVLVFLLLTLNM